MDLLKKAAKAWRDLYNVKYSITYGRKGKLYDINITFKRSDFHHLAGFQYLKDLKLPAIPQNRYVEAILKNDITGKTVIKGENYDEMVKIRLLAIIDLQEALDKSVELYNFNPSNCPFHTNIAANNLVFGNSESNDIFVFLVEHEDRYVCSSIFLKENRDFTENQIPLSILRIVKTNLNTQEQTVFIDKLSEQQDKPSVPIISAGRKKEKNIADRLTEKKEQAAKINANREKPDKPKKSLDEEL